MNQSEALSRCEQWFTAQVMHFVPRAVLSLSISDFSDDDGDEDDDDDDDDDFFFTIFIKQAQKTTLQYMYLLAIYFTMLNITCYSYKTRKKN